MRSEEDRWYRAFDRVHRRVKRLPMTRCPSCGERSLNLVYRLTPPHGPESGVALFAFWCGSCLRGVPPAFVPIPTGATVVSDGDTRIPNYRSVVQ